MNIDPELLTEAFRRVIDPVTNKDLMELKRIRYYEIIEDTLHVDIEVSQPTMHVKKKIESQLLKVLKEEFGEQLKVEVKFVLSVTDNRKDDKSILPDVKNIIAISSGKGGVGKSTVSSNLAVALARKGYKVGLVDADIYGPSVPIMFDVENRRPKVEKIGEKNYIIPVEQYGVKMLSIGFFADVSQAVVWRGPMASKALRQMFVDAYWGELDYLLIDLPPGTGDIHLTLVQSVPVTGALIVSTPQKVAIADARKGIGMFNLPSIKVPVLGLVENMAYFTPAELPENKYYIFGKDGAENLALEMNVALLGKVPIVQSICEGGDSGNPVALDSENPAGKAFMELADRLTESVLSLKTV
jgi:ATP-binding protein involved in chromosome partitioning